MKLMVIDGNSILSRAFYGISALTNANGTNTNAIYGFLTTYFKLLNEETPDKIVVCFDVKAKTFRHEQFEDYKGTRKPMPDELAEQIPLIKEVLDNMGVDRYELAGFEADDLIGTISNFCDENNHQCIIITGDKDSLQLASKSTTINLVSTRMGKTTTKKVDISVFREIYGFEPMILTDLKGLMGDTSDNIPGVKGVGEKTAMALLHKFKNIEGIYENIDDDSIKKGAREKLIFDKDNAFKSRELATIIKNVEFDFDIDRNIEQNDEKLFEILEKLELRRIIKLFDLKIEKKQSEKIEIIAPKLEILENLSYLTEQCYICGNIDNFYILCKDTAFLLNKENPQYNSLLDEVFSEKIPKIMHNAKEFIADLIKLGKKSQGIIFDTALAMYLLEPSRDDYDLAKMSEEILGFEIKQPELSLFETHQDNEEINTVVIKHLYNILEPKLFDMKDLYYNIELPLMTVLADMQICGVTIDDKELRIYGEKLMVRIKELTELIYKSADEEFNINSPKQLGVILFEKLNLKAIKKTKTGYSTNVEVLEFLKDDHEIIPLILEYRSLAKLHSTYVEGLLKVIKSDGKIHSTLNQMVTTTGRLSSTEPNLQNIPVRTPLGSELRKMFVASEGNILIDADYSQIELRILAHIAKDTVMIDAFKSGTDIHTVTASQVFNTEISEVTPFMRSSAKAVNFGIVYGISEFSLGNDIGVTRLEAKEYMDNYLEKYAGVANYMVNIKEKAHKDGYVTTLFGRKRKLPELKSKNFNIRSFGERVALNTPIQGTAADIIKIAMVNVYNRLNAEKLQSKLILQIHDELIIEAPLSEKDIVAKILQEEMQNAFSGEVLLVVDYNFGKNWYEAK